MSNSCDAVGRPRVAVVVSGWPRVSEVFAVNELLSLQRAGMLAGIFATKSGETGPAQPEAQALAPLVSVLPAGDAPAQADVLVARLAGSAVAGVHGYFAHQPAAVAAATAERLGVPYSFSAHALDARKVTPQELAERANRAAAVICCNTDVARHLHTARRQPHLVHHGVELTRFPATSPPSADVLRLLAVGRLVAKKGFDVLLEAVSMLTRPWQLRLIGAGPLHDDLLAMIADLGIDDRVELLGRCTHETLPAHYAWAHVVVAPSVVDVGADRDGLPNVVLEAMASARPVVASDLAAIPTAVRDGITGRLVPPRDTRALAGALERLADDAGRRRRMGLAGRHVVQSEFDLTECTATFRRTMEQVYG